MIYGIQHITPSYPINRQIWRWAHNRTEWDTVERVIAQQIAQGNVNKSIDVDVVKRVATKTYGL